MKSEGGERVGIMTRCVPLRQAVTRPLSRGPVFARLSSWQLHYARSSRTPRDPTMRPSFFSDSARHLVVVTLVGSLAGCGGGGEAPITPPPPPPPPVTVASVTVAPDSSDVRVGGSATLGAVTRDASGNTLSGRAVTWTTGSAAIATVSAAGVVTGVAPGTVTITAESEGRQGTARVRVTAASLAVLVDSFRVAFNLPALGAAIVTRDGGTTAIGVAGTRRFGQNLPVTTSDKWHLGSNTKTMTAYLAALTIKAGRLAYGDSVMVRYPQLRTVARTEYLGLTLQQLLTMQSRIVGNPGFNPTGTAAEMRSAVDTWAVQQPPASGVGEFFYSNIAYQVAGEIIGRAWGTGYEQALRDRLWTPMGITTGGFGPTTGAGMNDQPIGHFPGTGNSWTPCEACDNFWATGSGMVHMALPDWARFTRELLRMDAGQSSLLTQAESRALGTPLTPIGGGTSFGMGWVVFTNSPTQRVWTFEGTNIRNRARLLMYPDAGLAFLLVTNAGDPAADGGAPNAAFNALATRLQAFHRDGR